MLKILFIPQTEHLLICPYSTVIQLMMKYPYVWEGINAKCVVTINYKMRVKLA